MRRSIVKAKLARNEPVLLTVLYLTDPSVFELTAMAGFDGIWVDIEHHAHSVETVSSLIRAARAGSTDVMVRPAKGEFMSIGRLLEAGAQGIMYPRCDDAKEAAEVVTWSKFAPLGRRGVDGANPDMPYCSMPIADYVRMANEETFLVVQLEEPGAVEQAEAIAAVEGIDVLFFGPGDFSVACGIPGQFEHPDVQDAMRRVAAAARNSGKHWGTPAFSSQHARKLLDLGATFLCHGVDLLFIKQAQARVQEEFAELGFRFRNTLSTSQAASNTADA